MDRQGGFSMNRYESSFLLFVMCMIAANTGPSHSTTLWFVIAATWLLKCIYHVFRG